MTRKFIHLDDARTQGLIEAFRSRHHPGNIPTTKIGWDLREAHRREVLDEIITPDVRKRIDNGHQGVRAEYRDVISMLNEGEPAQRVVDPVGVPGHIAAIDAGDADGYLEQSAARDASMGVSSGE